MTGGSLETVHCPDCGAPSRPGSAACWMCRKDISQQQPAPGPARAAAMDLPKTRYVLIGAFLLLCLGFAVRSLAAGGLALIALFPAYITLAFAREIRDIGHRFESVHGVLGFVLRGAVVLFFVWLALFFAMIATCTFIGAVSSLSG